MNKSIVNQMSLSEMLTYSTVRIECKNSTGKISLGTGFIMNLHTSQMVVPVIITNKHVVEGCIQTTFVFIKADDSGNPIDTDPFNIIINEGNAWRNHPNPQIDLCFLPLKSVLDVIAQKGCRVFYIPLDSEIIADDSFLSSLCAVEEVVMIGYPQGLMDTFNHKPVVRRGITATHPKNDYLGKPEILLDIAAYHGSSGSPVFILNEGSYYQGNILQIGSRLKLIGILYGGPEIEASGIITFSQLPVTPIIKIPMNLGVVIKAKEIKRIEAYIKTILDKE